MTFIASGTGTVLLTILGVYAVLSAIAFALYGVDKSAAEQHRRRIPEATLHLVSLAGGWPGALVGRHVFRHKTRKQPFRSIFWVTVVANCAALVWLLATFADNTGVF